MKLYGMNVSSCTQKALTVFAEKGHEVELIEVNVLKGEDKLPAHLALQPFGEIPVLEDDGFLLYESRAIIRYLDQRLPGPSLTPADLKQRALMEQWISVEHSYFTPAAMKVITQAVFNPMMYGKPADEDLLKAGRESTTKAVLVLDAHLNGKDFLVANQFTIADICYLPYIEYIYACKNGDVFDKFTNVTAWWKRTSERPSWQTAIGK